MTVELACRLLESRVLLRTEVAQALLDASTRGIAFVQSVVERIPGATVMLESEFSRWPGQTLSSIRVDVELARALPTGMCERLLALPLQRSADSESIALAVVDPFDVHVMSEFEYCLSAAIKPVRVAYSVLVAALGAARAASERKADVLLDIPDDETPAFGTRVMRGSRRPEPERPMPRTSIPAVSRPRRGLTVPSIEAPRTISDAPIPLVRTTLAPGVHRSAYSVDQTPLPTRIERDSEPILRLVKQKQPIVTSRVSLPPPPKFGAEEVVRPEALLRSLDDAKSARQLIELLGSALQRIAPCQAYFSVRARRYVAERVSEGERPDEITLTAEQQALLGKACATGYWLGQLPADGSARALGAALGVRAREEVYVAPISVSNRPVLVVVVARFEEAFTATRWVDSVVARASQVLERIALTRKER